MFLKFTYFETRMQFTYLYKSSFMVHIEMRAFTQFFEVTYGGYTE